MPRGDPPPLGALRPCVLCPCLAQALPCLAQAPPLLRPCSAPARRAPPLLGAGSALRRLCPAEGWRIPPRACAAAPAAPPRRSPLILLETFEALIKLDRENIGATTSKTYGNICSVFLFFTIIKQLVSLWVPPPPPTLVFSLPPRAAPASRRLRPCSAPRAGRSVSIPAHPRAAERFTALSFGAKCNPKSHKKSSEKNFLNCLLQLF